MTNKNVVINLEIGHKATVRAEKTSDGYTHDWEVFVQGAVSSHIEAFIEKVIFYLHESFQKPKRVLKSPPYRVCEKGYGCFTLNIEVCFRSTEEPRRAKFEYDLYLQPLDNPPISKIRREKLTFIRPNDEFRKKLLQAGAAEIPSVEESKVDEKTQKPRTSSGAKTKPAARVQTPSASGTSAATTSNNTAKKSKIDVVKKEPAKLKGSDQFTALFGEIIKPNNSSQKVKESSANKPPKDTKSQSVKPEYRSKSKEKVKDSKALSESDKEHSKKDSKSHDKKKTDVEKNVLEKERSHERDKKKLHDKKHSTKEGQSVVKDKYVGSKPSESRHKSGKSEDRSKIGHSSSSLSPEHRSNSKNEKRKENDLKSRKEHNSSKEEKKRKSSSSSFKEDDKKSKINEEKNSSKEAIPKSKSAQPPPMKSASAKERAPHTAASLQPVAKASPQTAASSFPVATQKPPPPIPQRGRPRKDARFPPLSTSTVPAISTVTATNAQSSMLVPSHSKPQVVREPVSKPPLALSPRVPPPPSVASHSSPPKLPPPHSVASRSTSSSRSRSPSLSLSSSSSRSSTPTAAPSQSGGSSRSSSPSNSPSPERSRSVSGSSSSASSKSASKSPSLSESSSEDSSPSAKELEQKKNNSSQSSHSKSTINPLDILARDISESSSEGDERILPSHNPPPPPATTTNPPSSATRKSPRATPKNCERNLSKENTLSRPKQEPKKIHGTDVPASKHHESPYLSATSSDESDSDLESHVSSKTKAKADVLSPARFSTKGKVSVLLSPTRVPIKGKGGVFSPAHHVTLPNAEGKSAAVRPKEKNMETSPLIKSSPTSVSNGITSRNPSKSNASPLNPGELKIDANYIDQLWELKNKIMTSFSDRNKVQEIVKIISSASDFHINHTHFTFDLCALDKQTIRKLQHYLT